MLSERRPVDAMEAAGPMLMSGCPGRLLVGVGGGGGGGGGGGNADRLKAAPWMAYAVCLTAPPPW